MRLTKFSGYSLRVPLYLGQHNDRLTCRVARACKLRHALHDATAAFFRILNAHTLKSIAIP